MSSVVRCRANSQKQTTILCRVLFRWSANSELQTTILFRVLLDVEQTLNNRQQPMSSVVRCRANSR